MTLIFFRMVTKKDERGSIYFDARESKPEEDVGISREPSVYFDAAQSMSVLNEENAPQIAKHHRRISIEEPSTLLSRKSLQKPFRRSNRSIRRESTLRRMQLAAKEKFPSFAFLAPQVKVGEWGFPGELTKDELTICQTFHSELNERDSVYKEMVRAFSTVEDEAYSLCRFLRARKFDIDEVFKMMDDAVPFWKEAKAQNFYPDLNNALGAPLSVVTTQFPTFKFGIAKNGCPVTYTLAGRINAEGINCMIDLDGLLKVQWNNIMFQFVEKIAESQAEHPSFVRCEGMNVMDLKGLSASQLNSNTLDVIKKQSDIAVCFPETLNKMVILNAPGFFSLSWRAIRKFLNPSTAQKIEVISNEKKGIERMKALIADHNLPSDYGGNAASTASIMEVQCQKDGVIRQFVEQMNNRKKKHEFELKTLESVTLSVFTRSVSSAKFSLRKDSGTLKSCEILHSNASTPSCTKIAGPVQGPGKLNVVAEFTGACTFLLVGEIKTDQ